MMAVLRISGEGYSVTMTDDLEQKLGEVFLRAVRAVTAELNSTLEPIATKARVEWYGPNGVKRVTGASGDIVVVNTIAADMSSVSVSIGSTDTRMVKGADGRSRPRATAIHRPGSLASVTRRVVISKEEYFRRWRINKEQGPRYKIAEGTVGNKKGGTKTGVYYGLEAVPGAANKGDGTYLLPKLVLNPTRAALRAINVRLGRRIAASIKGA